MKKNILCLLTVILLLFTGCKKEKTEDLIPTKPPTQMEFWNCHSQTIWHTETVFEKLVGKWKWFYTLIIFNLI